MKRYCYKSLLAGGKRNVGYGGTIADSSHSQNLRPRWLPIKTRRSPRRVTRDNLALGNLAVFWRTAEYSTEDGLVGRFPAWPRRANGEQNCQPA